MKKTITIRQLILIMTISVITIKVLILPNLFFSILDKDAYIGLFFMLICDFISLLMILFIMTKFPDKTFYEILEFVFGKFLAKIFMFIFFCYFLNKCWTKFQGNFVYLNENLYSTFNWYMFSIPMFVSLVFCVLQGIKPTARLIEIFAPIVIIGFLVALIFGTCRCDFSNILPVMERGIKPVFSSFKLSHWFGDYLVLFLFCGRVNLDKKQDIKIILWGLGIIFLLTFFYIIFYGTYRLNSICHTNAISDILQVLPSLSDLGSFDWILILVWDISLFLSLLLDTLCAFYCFQVVFTKKLSVLFASILVLFMVVINYLLGFNFLLMLNLAQKYFSIFSLIVVFILPFIIFLFCLFKRRKQYEVFAEK